MTAPAKLPTAETAYNVPAVRPAVCALGSSSRMAKGEAHPIRTAGRLNTMAVAAVTARKNPVGVSGASSFATASAESAISGMSAVVSAAAISRADRALGSGDRSASRPPTK